MCLSAEPWLCAQAHEATWWFSRGGPTTVRASTAYPASLAWMSFLVHIHVHAQIVATLVGIVPKAVATGVVSKDRNAVATSATSAPTVGGRAGHGAVEQGLEEGRQAGDLLARRPGQPGGEERVVVVEDDDLGVRTGRGAQPAEDRREVALDRRRRRRARTRLVDACRAAQGVTSLAPMSMVTRSTLPLWARRNSTAAATCDPCVVGAAVRARASRPSSRPSTRGCGAWPSGRSPGRPRARRRRSRRRGRRRRPAGSRRRASHPGRGTSSSRCPPPRPRGRRSAADGTTRRENIARTTVRVRRMTGAPGGSRSATVRTSAGSSHTRPGPWRRTATPGSPTLVAVMSPVPTLPRPRDVDDPARPPTPPASTRPRPATSPAGTAGCPTPSRTSSSATTR